MITYSPKFLQVPSGHYFHLPPLSIPWVYLGDSPSGHRRAIFAAPAGGLGSGCEGGGSGSPAGPDRPYQKLIDRLIDLGVERHREKLETHFSR